MKTIREIAAWAMLCLVFCSFSTDENTMIAYPIIEVHPQKDGDVQMMVNVPRRGNDTIVSLPIYRFNETDVAGNFLKMLTDTISHDYKYNAQRLYIPDEYNTSNFTLESAFGLDELGSANYVGVVLTNNNKPILLYQHTPSAMTVATAKYLVKTANLAVTTYSERDKFVIDLTGEWGYRADMEYDGRTITLHVLQFNREPIPLKPKSDGYPSFKYDTSWLPEEVNYNRPK
jgi:hypothetical protein